MIWLMLTFLVGYVVLFVLVVNSKSRECDVGVEEVLDSALWAVFWPLMLAILTVFTILYTIAWVAVPGVRKRGSLIACIKDFWT